jgi:hypothetical protein
MRRVIELGAGHLVAHWPQRVRAVILASGEAPDRGWLRAFRQRLLGTRVTVFTEPAFGYASELRGQGPQLERQVRDGLDRLWFECGLGEKLVWAHTWAGPEFTPAQLGFPASAWASCCRASSRLVVRESLHHFTI